MLFSRSSERSKTPGTESASTVLRMSLPSAAPSRSDQAPSSGTPIGSVGTTPASANTSRLHGMCKQLQVVLADKPITAAEDLVRVPFEGCLNKDLDLAAHLSASVAVLATDATKKTAVLLATETASHDVVQAVISRLNHRGIALTSDGPQLWACATPVLMSVAGGDLKPEHARVIRSRQQDKTESALWQSFRAIVQWATENQANDIDFKVNLMQPTSQVYFKIDGRYITLERWQLPTETILAMLGNAWQNSQGGAGSKFEPREEQQCRIDVAPDTAQHVRLRWASMSTDKGVTVTMRIQRLGSSQVVTSLEAAGFLPEHIEIFTRATVGKGGLTTLSGTVGSGKSVTLAILMKMLPRHLKGVTFEDPVEIDMPWLHQKTISRDLVGDDDRDFQAGVRTLFRSALDVFLQGEVRDQATGRVIRAILESGHSCYTTTHAMSALGIFTKYASPQVGMPLDLLATPGMLRLNVYQSLLLTNCKCALAPDDLAQVLNSEDRQSLKTLMGDIESLYGIGSKHLRMRNPQGCPHCRRPGLEALWGYSGRTVAAEMLEPDETMCEFVFKGDMLGLKRYWKSLSDGDVSSSSILGKSAMDIAMHKAAQGLIDPREIELHFDSFRSLASKQEAERRIAARKNQARLKALPIPAH